MNDMKEPLIDLKFFFIIFNKIYFKFINLFIVKCFYIVLVLHIFFYMEFFYNIKHSNNLKFLVLNDFTVVHNINYLNEFELIYIFLSYKLNTRLMLKLYVRKEDLIMSLSNLYKNAT